MKFKIAVLVVLVTTSIPQAAGAGGGWWSFIDVRTPYVAPGGWVVAKTPFTFEDLDHAEKALGVTYHAYLIEGLDQDMVDEGMSQAWNPSWWKPRWVDVHEVGRVKVASRGSNLARSRIRFQVPELAPGRYDLMFCTKDCMEPLGMIVPTKLEVVGDPLAAKTASSFRNYRFRATMALKRVKHDLRDTRRTVRALEEKVHEVEGRLERLSKASAHPERAASEEALSAVSFIAVALAALAFVPLWRRRYRSRSISGSDGPDTR